MTNLTPTQKRIWQNVIDHGFNTTNIEQEFLLLYGEVAEAYEAWLKAKPDLGEELADIAIYLFGLAEMNHLDLGQEIDKKMTKNESRTYEKVDGVPIRIKEGNQS